jgi:cysteine desulfurase
VKPIYLDYNSTTPVDPEVFKAMQPYFCEAFGNPSSETHSWGWEAATAVRTARTQVADLLGAQTSEIVFTSGATESNNWVFQSLVKSFLPEKIHVITSPTEHASVLEPLQFLENVGAIELSYFSVDHEGLIDPQELLRLVRPNTKLVSVMWVQNETGVIQNLETLGQLCRQHKIYLHTDATQALGKIEIDLKQSPIDLMSFSAHKIYGPKGIGGLFIRSKNPSVRLLPLFYGGDQEKGFRSGTLNVPGIVGLGKACEILNQAGENFRHRTQELGDFFWRELSLRFPEVKLNGSLSRKAANTWNLNFEVYKINLPVPGLALSQGSACQSGHLGGSHVLKAMGMSQKAINSSFRLSFGRNTTQEQLLFAIDQISKAARKDVFQNPAVSS